MLPTAMRHLARVGLWSVLWWAALACTQDAGEVCQVDGDCADGLECDRTTGSSRGMCVGPGDVDAGSLGGTGGVGGLGGLGGLGGAGGGDAAIDAAIDAAMTDDDAGSSDAGDGDAGGA